MTEQKVLLNAMETDKINLEPRQNMLQIARVVTLGFAMIMTSAGLIAFNKHLVSGGFPHPTQLVVQHAAFSTIMASVLYIFKPSLFPKLTDPLVRVTVDRNLMIAAVLPIALLFAGHLVLSNTAYLYSTIPFLQMLKESNIVVTYVFSLLASLEKLNPTSVFLILAIVVATGATIQGEIHFSLAGFFIQGCSIFCESGKAVLQNLILSNTGRKLDPMTYVLLVSPVCFTILALVLMCFHYTGSTMITVADRASLLSMMPILLLNCMVAFALNCLMAAFVHASSAMSFVIAGILKDIMIVVAGVLFMKETISGQQGIAFTAQIMLITMWASMKMFPNEFENGMIAGFRNLAAKARGCQAPKCDRDNGPAESKSSA